MFNSKPFNAQNIFSIFYGGFVNSPKRSTQLGNVIFIEAKHHKGHVSTYMFKIESIFETSSKNNEPNKTLVSLEFYSSCSFGKAITVAYAVDDHTNKVESLHVNGDSGFKSVEIFFIKNQIVR